MKKMVEIYSSGNEYYYYLDGKKRGGFSTKEKAKADAKEMNRERKARGKKKVATSQMPKREDRFRQIGDTRLFKPGDRRMRIKKSEWFSILKNRRRFNVKKPKDKKGALSEKDRKKYYGGNSKISEAAEKRRKELKRQSKTVNKKRVAKKMFDEVQDKLHEFKLKTQREVDKILKENEDSLEKTERAIEDFVYRNVERYAIMQEYLKELYDYVYQDKDIEELEEHKLSGPTFTQAFSDEALEPYRKYLRGLFGRYACKDCGTEFPHKDDWPCKYCGNDKPNDWTRIR